MSSGGRAEIENVTERGIYRVFNFSSATRGRSSLKILNVEDIDVKMTQNDLEGNRDRKLSVACSVYTAGGVYVHR